MAEEKIIIDIDEDGVIMAKTEGLKGELCLSELEEILESSPPISSVKKTDEYYQSIKGKSRDILKRGKI